MNKKLLVCDVEGTIFAARYKLDGMDYASTMWQPLANSLGEEGERREKELHDRWEGKEFAGYLDWVKATCEMHRNLGLTKQIFDRLLNLAEYNHGVVSFFEQLDRNTYIPVLISGGFQELVRRAQSELKIPHGHGACEYFFDKSDNLLSLFSLVPCDWEGKYRYVRTLLDDYGCNPNLDWVFIGDGKNDCDIASRAPISFAFDAHQRLREIATYCIDGHDDSPASFSEVADILSTLTEHDFENGHKRAQKLGSKIHDEKREINKVKFAKKSRDEVLVLDRDYVQTPEMHLSELLAMCRVAFIGQRKNHNSFVELEDRYDNLKMIEANFEHKNNADYKALKQRDFIFVYVDCISHSQGWRIEELGVPFAKIKRHNGEINSSEPTERAMANVLYRHFVEKDNQ
ncbi:hypothetical protein AGMMS50229_13190 [Campylobacterota bacterium]|nr:hypothetical protein AGMMS50229_13190 [Campylobacterota bacterium]